MVPTDGLTPRRPGASDAEPAGPVGDAALDPADAPGAADVAYVRNTALMTAGTILSRATGLVRVSVLAWALGVSATSLADTYNTANTAPNILYELVLGGILTSVFVPVFVQWRQERGREAAWRVADRVLTIATVLLTALVALGVAFAPAIARLYMPEADEAQLALGTYLLRWFMPQVVFYGIGAIAGGLLNAEGRFAAPMFAPVLNNLVVIASVVAYASIRGDAPATVADVSGVQRALLGAGTTLGVVAMTLALWPSLRRTGYRWRPRLETRHPAVRRLVELSAWVMLYVAANQVAYAIVVRIANSLSDGSLTAYQYAFLIFSLPHAVFAVSIITALVPAMAERWTARDRDGLVERFSRGVRDTIAIMVPAAFGFVALAGPIARIVLQRGLVSAADAELVGRVLVAFAIGLPFFSVFQLLTRTFYAMQDSRTPAAVNVAAAGVHVATALTLVEVFDLGIAGAALGHAASYAVATVALLVVLRRRTGSLDGARIAATLARVVPV
ncbi:MAG TPA: murein biosynthesis integral membrane protein MurJ, partial [Actinomycetota bacterium]